MSFNQSRADRSDSSQYRKAGRSSSFSQKNNNYPGSTGKGGGAAAPPPSSNLQPNRSFSKKSNYAQGGQSRASEYVVISNPDSNSVPANRPAPNGSHLPPPVPVAPSASVSGTTVKQTTDQPAQRSAHVVQKAPSSQADNVKLDLSPHATPTKAPGEVSKYPIQFGSVSPGTLNGMQIPARTSSAPPNLVEQQHDQARRGAPRQAQQFPVPSIPKQQTPKKDRGTGDQMKTGDAHQIPTARRDIQAPSPVPVSQSQKAPVHNISGISMPMSFHHQQVPVQFGVPTPHIQSRGMAGASLPMPTPLPMGNAHQLPQSVYVPGLHPHLHPMQAQRIMHQGQGLSFTTHMGPQMPPHLGNMGIGAGPQFPPLQPSKYVGSRKAVKITHPETHEELRLENASGPRLHQNVPQPRPVSSVPSARPIYYPNPVSYSAQGPVPLNTTLNPSSQPPQRFSFPPNQGPQAVVNPSHRPSIVDGSHVVQKAVPSVPPTSVLVTIKSASGVLGEKMNDPLSTVSSVVKGVSQKQGEAISIHPQRDSESRPNSSSHRPKPLVSVPSVSFEENAPAAAHNTETIKNETVTRTDSIKDQFKNQNRKGSSQSPRQDPGQSTASCLPSQLLEHTNSCSSAPPDALGAKPLSTNNATGDLLDFKSESSTSSGAKIVVGSLVAELCGERNDIPTASEPSNLEDIETKGGKTLNEGGENDDTSLKTPSESAFSLRLEDSFDNSKTDNSLVSPASVVQDANELTSTVKTLTISDGDLNVSTMEASACGSESFDSKLDVVAKSSVSDDVLAPVSVFPSPDLVSRNEEAGAKYVNAGLVSLSAASGKEKPVPELGRSKNSKGKKKLKIMLQKADAAGKTSDLYNAYKGPDEKKETIAVSESINLEEVSVDSVQDDVCSIKKIAAGKAELDDWEDAVDISTPKLGTADNINTMSGGIHNLDRDGIELIAKKYTRDFLLKLCAQCTDLPDDFEITSDVDTLMCPNGNASRESYPSPGMVVDRSPGGRRGVVVGDGDRWNRIPSPLVSGHELYGGNFRHGQGGNHCVLRTPRGSAPTHHAGGILSGPMQPMSSQGGMQRSEADRWQRATSFQKGLIPSPTTPAPVMHKAERKYQVGKITDEEEVKQRQLKAILNKLTPQNFEKLFEQVKAVNIDNAGTLTGVISQIFDKALMEPTFCEMYADFCYHLAGVLPDFSEDNEKITFKRLLLNKCQEEFERGEREQEEADRADVEGEVNQSPQEREEKRIQTRRRMLGNIRLIGELYKKRMLTERIMHECIKKLLGQCQNPDEEDIEALCKLMSTIGEMIDHPKAKVHMDAYFDMMSKLSNNMNLSSRVRFMLKDAIDLRKNKWQQRRKVEGPKKIDEVHRDAAQERQVQAGRLARGGPGSNSSGRNRQPMDYSSRGSSMLPSPNSQMGGYRGLQAQPRGFGVQDTRIDDRHSFESRTLSVQRPLGEESIIFGPQGGLARGMSTRGQPSIPNTPLAEDSRKVGPSLNGPSFVRDRSAYGSREDLMPRYMSERVTGPYDQAVPLDRNMIFGTRDVRNADRTGNRSRPSSPNVVGGGITPTQNVSSGKIWPEERLREMSLSTIKEYYSAKDEKEVTLCVKDMNAPSFYPTMISLWVSDSFERKDMERESLAKLIINLSKSQDPLLNHDHLIKGFESVLSTLEDAVNDAPKAGEFLGGILAKIVIEDVIPFSEIGLVIFEGGEEPGSLVEAGLAAEVVGTILEIIKLEKGDFFLNEICANPSSKLERFRPPNSKKLSRLDKFI